MLDHEDLARLLEETKAQIETTLEQSRSRVTGRLQSRSRVTPGWAPTTQQGTANTGTHL